jgi:hypothetical protein
MLILVIFQLILSAILYFIFKLSKIDKISKIKKFFKQGLTTLILFNSFNISFSVGIQFKYSNYNTPFYMLHIIFVAISLLMIIFSIFIL